MSGAALALLLTAVHLVLVFGVQEVVQRRRTGRSSWVDPADKPPTERVADGLFALGMLLVLGAPVLVLAGLLDPAFDAPVVQAAGAGVILLATVGAKWAQHTMGAAWRTGVAGGESPELVVGGAFRWVRNPVYTALLATAAGAAALAPTAVALAGALVLLAALELQTREVEEPHLRAAHGAAYERYAASTGRFLPGLGRLRGRGRGT